MKPETDMPLKQPVTPLNTGFARLENGAAEEAPLDSGRFAVGLRWAGALAVVASATVYMLQGLNHIDLDMRNWLYLGLMALLGLSGVASQKLLQDAKSSRLFLGLAALLIPVQFSQLGGQVHDLVNVLGAEVPYIGWLLLGTLALALPVAHSALSVLARADRRVLLPSLLMLSAVLLLPGRASVAGFVVLVAMVIATLLIEVRVFRSNSAYRSLEGRGVRLLIAAPVLIAMVRMSLHVDTISGFAVMGGIGAFVCSRCSAQSKLLRALAAVLGALSWCAYAYEAFPFVLLGGYALCLLFLPIALWCMDLARIAGEQGGFYRKIATVLVALTALSLLLEGGMDLALVALLLGALLLGWGVLRSLRVAVLMGAVIVIAAFVVLLVASLDSVEVNSWVALGIAGVALVFSASLLEKYGKPAIVASKRAWQRVAAWD